MVSKFEIESHYCIHFQRNILVKDIYSIFPPSYGLNSTTPVILNLFLCYAKKKQKNKLNMLVEPGIH